MAAVAFIVAALGVQLLGAGASSTRSVADLVMAVFALGAPVRGVQLFGRAVRSAGGRARGAHSSQAAVGLRGDDGAPGAHRADEPEDQRRGRVDRATPSRRAGAITVGKTNTLEWDAGSNTFNPIFGATVNPYDRTMTVGGSSGGAAAALRCGMVPIAGGSDMGGDGATFRAPLGRSFRGARVAWFKGMGGIPFEPEIRSVVNENRHVFADLGCGVHDDEPDFCMGGESPGQCELVGWIVSW